MLFAHNLAPYTHRLHALLWRTLIAAQVLLTLLYVVWIQYTPEWPARAPRSIAEVLFLVLFFGYGMGVSVIVLQSAFRFFSNDRYPLAQVRTLVGIGMAFLFNLCTWLKIAFAILVYQYPHLPLVERIDRLALLAMTGTAILIMPLLVPHHVYVKVLNALQIGEKVLTLIELRRLQARLFRLCPSVVWHELSWWDQLRNLELYLYRTVISILDSHTMIVGYLERMEHSGASRLEAKTAGGLLVWDEADIAEARLLSQLLETVPETDYDALVQTYRRVSRQLRQNKSTIPYRPRGLPAIRIRQPHGQAEEG